MSKKDEALKLALEALEDLYAEQNAAPLWKRQEHWQAAMNKAEAAMPAIREALADQPAQQEPVAWVCEASSSDEKHAIDYWPGDVDDLPIGTKLYTSPPASKPWVGLDDADLAGCDDEELKQARYWERVLREKNA